MSKKESVGLIVMADFEPFGACALLQERGRFDFEKMRPQSWPGGCQATVHGKVEEGENFESALRREIQEELGIHSLFFEGQYQNDFPFELIHISDTLENRVQTYMTFIFLDRFLTLVQNLIRLEPSSGGIRIVSEKDLENIEDLTKFDKERGVADRRILAMFPDEKEALEQSFSEII